MGRRKPDYLDEMQEWQEKQFTPGAYYPPGQLPFYLRGHGNCLLLAIVFFCNAVLGAVFAVWFLCIDDTGMRIAGGVMAVVTGLFVSAGLNFLKKHRQRCLDAKRRRVQIHRHSKKRSR